jgi:hypothetical protein
MLTRLNEMEKKKWWLQIQFLDTNS